MSKFVKKSGFSLIEMIVVIVIIGIIAAIAVPKLLNTKDEAIVSAIKQDVATAVSSIRSYYLMNGKIEHISDAVNLNSERWSGTESLTAIFKDGEVNCVQIIVDTTTKKLTVDMIPTDPANVCEKLYDAGIIDQDYSLN